MGVVGNEGRDADVASREERGPPGARSPAEEGGIATAPVVTGTDERRPRMVAVQAACFGGPDVLVPVERSAPRPGAGEVLIEVAAADVLLADTWIRRGQRGARLVVDPPYVPGCGVAGEVVSVGEGVAPALVGLRVAAHAGRHGGYADLVAVPVEQLVPIPAGLGESVAAALIHDGPAALTLVERAGIRAGDRVLVTAAAGGVGSLLVQLANAAGARVMALARGGAKLDLVRTLGADVAIDAGDARWAGAVLRATDGRGVDVVLDGVGGRIGRIAFDVTARGGRFTAYGAASGELADIDPESAIRRGVRFGCAAHLHPPTADAARLTARALDAGAAGRLRPFIGQTFPIRNAAGAHAAMEARATIGKTLLTRH
jgi:NADPH:quinone reductase